MWRVIDADSDMLEVTEMVACSSCVDAIFRGALCRNTPAHFSATNELDARGYRRHRQ